MAQSSGRVENFEVEAVRIARPPLFRDPAEILSSDHGDVGAVAMGCELPESVHCGVLRFHNIIQGWMRGKAPCHVQRGCRGRRTDHCRTAGDRPDASDRGCVGGQRRAGWWVFADDSGDRRRGGCPAHLDALALVPGPPRPLAEGFQSFRCRSR